MIVDIANDVGFPGNTHDMIQLAYGPDVVDKTIRHLKTAIPSFVVPEGFFQSVCSRAATKL